MRKTAEAWTYLQHNADDTLEYPGEGYGGWQKRQIPLDPAHTAIVLMHVWDVGTIEQVPEVYRTIEYVPRSNEIMTQRLPAFLEKARASDFPVIHIGSQSEKSLESLPGYRRVKEKWGLGPAKERVASDPVREELQQIWAQAQFGDNIDGMNEARVLYRDFGIMPRDEEDVVCTTHQLFSLCRERGINHLIYTGFAVNACLVSSPCGWVDMSRHGVMCSVVRELTTAVENKESCRTQAHKEYGLWNFVMGGGFVFDQTDLEKIL